MSFTELIDTKLMPLFSLSVFDRKWQETINGSLLMAFWQRLKSLLPRNEKLALFLDRIAFGLVCLLFILLPAPQFAEDKGFLAIIVIGAYGFQVLSKLLLSKHNYKASAVDACVLAFAFINLIAACSSHYLLPSLKGLAKMAVYIVSYFVFVGSLQTNPRLRLPLAVGGLLLSAGLVSLYGIYQYKIGVAPLATWEDPTVESKTTRVYATLKNPNLLAGYLVPLLPLSFAAAISALKSKSKALWLFLPLLAGAAALSACLVFTGSRGGYMGMGAGFLALGFVIASSVWRSKPKLRPLIILSALALPLIFFAGLHQFPRYEQRILSIFAGREHSSNSYRLNVYSSSFKMFLDSWWIGIGPGNSTFKLAYGLYMRSGFDALGTYCVPLEIAVETGIGGLLIFGGLLLSTVSRAHLHFWNGLDDSRRWLIAGAAAGLIAMMVHGLVDTVFYRPQVQFIFWLLTAICVCGLSSSGSSQARASLAQPSSEQNSSAANPETKPEEGQQ